MKIKNAEEFIEDFLKWYVKEIADYTGFGYLNCDEGMWKDGDDNIHEIEEMGLKYLNNCNRQLSIGIEYCKRCSIGQINLIKVIKKFYECDDIQVTKNEEIKLQEYIGNKVLELMKEKKKEIEDEINSRQ